MATASFEQMSQAELQTAIGNAAQQISRMHDLQQAFTKGTHTFTTSGDRVGTARARVSGGWDGKAHSAADGAMSSMHDYMAQSQVASQSSAKTMDSMASTTRSHNGQAQGIPKVDTSFGASMRTHPHNPFSAVADNVQRHQEADANHAKTVAVANSLNEQGISHSNSMQSTSWPTVPQSAGTTPPSDLPPPPGAGGSPGGPGAGSPFSPGGGGGGNAVPVIGASRGRYTPTEEAAGTGRKRKAVFEKDPSSGGKKQTPVPTASKGGGTPGRSTDPSGLDAPTGSGTGPAGVEPVPGAGSGSGAGSAGAGSGALAGVGLGAGAIGLRGATGGGSLGRGGAGGGLEEGGSRGAGRGAGLEEGNGRGAGGGAGAEEGRLPGGRGGLAGAEGETLSGRGATGSGAGLGEGSSPRGAGEPARLGRGATSGSEPLDGRPGTGTEPGVRVGSSGAPAEELGGRGLGGPMGGSGRRRSDDDEEHGLPDYLVESDDFWAGEQSGSPAVIGE